MGFDAILSQSHTPDKMPELLLVPGMGPVDVIEPTKDVGLEWSRQRGRRRRALGL
jgi:hypothetical protein